jgi:hypothetical protein
MSFLSQSLFWCIQLFQRALCFCIEITFWNHAKLGWSMCRFMYFLFSLHGSYNLGVRLAYLCFSISLMLVAISGLRQEFVTHRLLLQGPMSGLWPDMADHFHIGCFSRQQNCIRQKLLWLEILCFCKQLLAGRTHLEASWNRSCRKFNAFLYFQSLFEKDFQVLTMQKS